MDAAALVLVDMAPHIEPEGSRRIQAFMDQKPEGFDTLQEVADAIANYQPHRPRPRLLDGLAKNVRLGADGKYHWHWDPARRRAWGDRLSGCSLYIQRTEVIVAWKGFEESPCLNAF